MAKDSKKETHYFLGCSSNCYNSFPEDLQLYKYNEAKFTIQTDPLF